MKKDKFNNDNIWENDSENLENTEIFQSSDEYVNSDYEDDIYNYDDYERVSIVHRRWFKVLASIIASLLVIGIVGFGYINKVAGDKDSLIRKNDKFLNKVNVYKGLNAAENFNKNIINVLIFGIDKNEVREESGKYGEIYRPDTVILTSINLETKTVSMTSIPRDTYVPLYGNRGKTKINASMYYGSIYGNKKNSFDNQIDCLLQTVSALFGGVPIDFYVGIDMDVVVKVVDAIGGVEFDVPYNIKYKGKIRIKKGTQILDGNKFLYMARERHIAGSDIERVGMQQKLLKALFNQAKKSNKLMAIPKIYQSLKEDIYTNMQFEQIASLAASAKDIDLNNINTYTFPGNYGSRDGISYWIINQSRRVALIKELFGITATPWAQEPLRVDTRPVTPTEPAEDEGNDGQDPGDEIPPTKPDEPQEPTNP